MSIQTGTLLGLSALLALAACGSASAGGLMQPEPLVVVAAVQKLARTEHLQRLLATPPDYVIVDEVHHADAPTYRRVLDALDPRLPARAHGPPDRADDGAVLARRGAT
jgi:superfamily II DNA or RNA helicase